MLLVTLHVYSVLESLKLLKLANHSRPVSRDTPTLLLGICPGVKEVQLICRYEGGSKFKQGRDMWSKSITETDCKEVLGIVVTSVCVCVCVCVCVFVHSIRIIPHMQSRACIHFNGLGLHTTCLWPLAMEEHMISANT